MDIIIIFLADFFVIFFKNNMGRSVKEILGDKFVSYEESIAAKQIIDKQQAIEDMGILGKTLNSVQNLWGGGIDITKEEEGIVQKVKPLEQSFKRTSDEFFNFQDKFYKVKTAYDEIKSKAPATSPSDFFFGDSAKEEYEASLSAVFGSDFEQVMDKAVKGDKVAQSKVTSLYDSSVKEWAELKDKDVKSLGQYEANKYAEKGLLEKVKTSYTDDYRNIGEQLLDTTVAGFTAGSMELSSGIVNLGTKLAGGVSSVLDSASNAVLSPFGVSINGADRVKKTGQDWRENIEAGKLDFDKWTNSILEIDNSNTSVVGNFVGQAAPLIAGSIGTGAAKLGAKLGVKTSSAVASKLGTSATSSFLSGASGILVDSIVSGVPAALLTSTDANGLNSKEFVNNILLDTIFAGTLYGAMKGAKFAGVSAVDTINKQIGRTEISKPTTLSANELRKKSSDVIDGVFKKVEDKTGVKISADIKSNAKSNIASLWDSTIGSVAQKVSAKVSTYKNSKWLKDISSDISKVDDVTSFAERYSIPLKELGIYGNGSAFTGMNRLQREMSATRVASNYDDSGVFYSADAALYGNIKNTSVKAFKDFVVKKLPDIAERISFSSTIPEIVSKLDNHPNQLYAQQARNMLLDVDNKIGSMFSNSKNFGDTEYYRGNSKDRAFVSMYGSAKSSKGFLKESVANRSSSKTPTIDSQLSYNREYENTRAFANSPVDLRELEISIRKESGINKLSPETRSTFINNIVDMNKKIQTNNGQISQESVTVFSNLLKQIEEVRYSAILGEGDVVNAIRYGQNVGAEALHESMFLSAIDRSVEASYKFKNKTHRAVVFHAIEYNLPISKLMEQVFINNATGDMAIKIGDRYYMDGIDISLSQRQIDSFTANMRNITPKEADEIIEASNAISDLSSQADEIKSAHGIMDEELMMTDVYIRQSFVNADGSKLTDTQTMELRRLLNGNEELTASLKSFKPSKENPFSKTQKREIKYAIHRDIVLKKAIDKLLSNNPSSSISMLNGVKTNRDPFARVPEMAMVAESAKTVSQAKALRILRNTSHIKVVYDKDIVKSQLKSIKHLVSDYGDRLADIDSGSSLTESINSIISSLSRFSDNADTRIDAIKKESLIGGKVDVNELEFINIQRSAISDMPELLTKFNKGVSKINKAVEGATHKHTTSLSGLQGILTAGKILPSSDGVSKVGVFARKVDEPSFDGEYDIYIKTDKFKEEGADWISTDEITIDDIVSIRKRSPNPIEIEDAINAIEMQKAEIDTYINQFKQQHNDIVRQKYELEKSGYVDGSTITNNKSFEGIFFSPQEALALRNISKEFSIDDKPTFFSELLNWTKFQRQMIASGDFFMTYKTVFATLETAGWKEAGKVTANNISAIANTLKNIWGINKGILSRSEILEQHPVTMREDITHLAKKWGGYIGMKNFDATLINEPLEVLRQNMQSDPTLRGRIRSNRWGKTMLAIEDATFNNMLPYAKLTAAEGLLRRMKELNPNKAEGELMIETGRYIDNAFSGQNWDVKLANNALITRKQLSAAPLFLFATDFLATKIGRLQNIGINIFDTKSVKGSIARVGLVRTALNAFVLLQAISFAITGKSTLENEGGEFWKVNFSPLLGQSADGKDIYVNVYGITGQALGMVNNGLGGASSQLSVPINMALDGVKNFEDNPYGLKTLNELAVPMGLQGLTEEVLSIAIDDYKSSKNITAEQSMYLALGNMIGLEATMRSPIDNQQKLFEAITSPDDYEPARYLSAWQKFVNGAMSVEEPSVYKAVGLNGKSAFEQIGNLAKDGDISKMNDIFMMRKEKDDYNVKEYGTEPKDFKTQTSNDLNKLLGAMIERKMSNGISYNDAIQLSITEIKEDIDTPADWKPKRDIIDRQTIKYILGGDIPSDIADEFKKIGIDNLIYTRDNGTETEKRDMLKGLESLASTKEGFQTTMNSISGKFLGQK